MVHQDKHAAYGQLKGAIHLDEDKSLLEKLKPTSKALRNLANPNKGKVQGDILWDLLDVASPEEIIRNRDVAEEISQRPSEPNPPPPPDDPSPEEILNAKLFATDLDSCKSDKLLKELVEGLNITVKNRKRKSRIVALKEAKEKLLNPDKDPPATDTTENKTDESPEPGSGEGEKNQETQASEGAGVSEDQMGAAGGSGHTEGSDSV